MAEHDDLFIDVDDLDLDEEMDVVTSITVTLTQPQLIELVHYLTGLHPNQIFRKRDDLSPGQPWPPHVLSLRIELEQLHIGHWMKNDNAFIVK